MSVITASNNGVTLKSGVRFVEGRSVLGPVLFLIYINDFDEDFRNFILKFADDTKVFEKVMDDKDKYKLQDDLNKLVSWAEKWKMEFIQYVLTGIENAY